MARKTAPLTEDWDTEEGFKLSPEDPIQVLIDRTPFGSSEDKKGHDSTLSARFPKSYARWVTKILETSGVPYEVRSDIVRDAIYLGLIILSMRYKLGPQWKIEAQLADITAKVEEGVNVYKHEEDFCLKLAELYARKEDGLVKESLQAHLALLSSFNDNGKRYSILVEKLRNLKIAHLLGQVEE